LGDLICALILSYKLDFRPQSKLDPKKPVLDHSSDRLKIEF